MVAPPIEPRQVSDLRELLHVVPIPAHQGIPAVGWARVALVLRSLQPGEPAVIAIEFADRSPLSIDWSRGHYWWDTSLAGVAIAPAITRLRMASGVRLPYMLEDPSDVEQLVWLVGLNAFGDDEAWWATPGARYTLDRWPDLGALPHTPEQMRLTALLGTGSFSAAELAESAAVEPGEANRLLAALDLLGLLAVAPAEATEPGTRGRRAAASGGLLSRLRARFGA